MRSRHRWGFMILAVALALAVASLPGCSKKRTRTITVGMSCLSVSPASGPVGGGTDVTISGSLFQTGATVLFGGAGATTVTVSPDGVWITCQTPTGTVGPVDVEVWNPGSVACRIAGGFLYLAPPQVTAVIYRDVNINCRIDAADSLEITFSTNVSFYTADPSRAFQLPVSGDTLGTGSQFQGGGMPTDVAMATVLFGASPTLEMLGVFDPSNLNPGSPSGVDVDPAAAAVVDAAYPAIAAIAGTPPGIDVSGFLGPTLWTSVGDSQNGAEFGRSVAFAGDVNGDGYADLIVGAGVFDTTNFDAGKAYVYHGGPSGLTTTPAWTSSGDDAASARFGHSVDGAGDVNADGFDDVVVGSYWFDTANTEAGKAYVYHGSAGGLSTTAAWTSVGDGQLYAHYGSAVSSAGDVNDDGFDDVIVGAYSSSTGGGGSQGKAFLHLGGSGGLSVSPAWTSSGDDLQAAHFGDSVASVGDANGDGFDDVIIGAPSFDNGSNKRVGKAYVYLGEVGGLATVPTWTSIGDDEIDAEYGFSVSSAGDVDADGFSDFIVGAWRYDGTGTSFGKAYLYSGAAGTISTSPAWTSSGDDQSGSEYGVSATSAGDVDADGYDDVIVSAYWYASPTFRAGKVYVYLGSASGLVATPLWTSIGDDQTESYFGWSVAGGGDIYNNGTPDLAVGAPYFDSPVMTTGKAYVYSICP